MKKLLRIPRQVTIVPDSHNESGEMEFIQGSYADKESGKTYDLFFLRMRTMHNAAWTVRKVIVAGEEMWSFKTSGFSGRSQFFVVNKVPVIAEINRYNMVKQIVCLADLGNIQVVTDGEREIMLGGYGLKAKILFKQEIVRQHSDLELGLSEEEKTILAKEESQKAQAAARVKAKEEAQRKERRERILARPVMTVFSAKSEKLYGQPVTADEWQILPIGEKGILVDAYDDETGQPGQPLEAFMVLKAKKGGSKERRVRSDELFLEKPGASNAPIKVQAILDFMVGHELASHVPVIKRDDLGNFAKKFNSGTRVALPMPEEGKYQIYELTHGEARTLCEAEPI